MEAINNPNHLDALKKAAIAIQRLQMRVEELEKGLAEPLAVVGMACRFPGQSNSIEQFWENLKNGFDARGSIPTNRFEIDEYFDSENRPGSITSRYGAFIDEPDQFDARYFGISAREAHLMDPQQRILLEVSVEALEDAFITETQLNGSSTGVFVGCMGHDYSEFSYQPTQIDIHTGTGTANSVLAGRISYLFNLHGPSVVVDTACSSSLVSVVLAAQSLRNKECDCAIAAGINLILSPSLYLIESRNQMLATDGKCKTFDDQANGFLRGEGCGAVILKRLSDAKRQGDRIYGLIQGVATNHNGKSSGLMVPSGKAQEQLLWSALRNGGVDPSQVAFVEAHGTGTALGDPIEVHALQAVYGKYSTSSLLLGSVKSNMGHLEGAAGIAGLIKALLSLYHRLLPPSIHFSQPNRHINWSQINITVNTKLTPLPSDSYGAVSSFGFSGTNSHVVLAPAQPVSSTSNMEGDALLVVSAKTEKALRSYMLSYQSFLQSTRHSWPVLCYSALFGRTHHKIRLALRAQNRQEALTTINTFLEGHQPKNLIQTGDTPDKALYFSPFDPDSLFNFISGKEVDLNKLTLIRIPVKVPIPGYPWEHQSYWIDNPGQGKTGSVINLADKKASEYLYEFKWMAVEGVKNQTNTQTGVLPVGRVPAGFLDSAQQLKLIIDPVTFNVVDRLLLCADLTGSGPDKAYFLAETLISTCNRLQHEQLDKKIDILLWGEEAHPEASPVLYALNAMLNALRTEKQGLAGSIGIAPVSAENHEIESLLHTLRNSDGSCLALKNGQLLQLQALKTGRTIDPVMMPETNGWIVVIGGTGSVGRHFIKSLISMGAENILLTSRNPSAINSEFHQPGIATLKFDPALKSDWDQLALEVKGKKISGLIHAAGHYSNRLLTSLIPEDLRSVAGPKVEGGQYLLEWCRSTKPTWVILNSSAVALTGAPYLSHYAFANGYLHGIGEQLNLSGIQATVIAWGGWKNSNMLNDQAMVNFQAHYGFQPLPPSELLSIAWYLIGSSIQQAMVVKVDWEKFFEVNQFQSCSWLGGKEQPDLLRNTVKQKVAGGHLLLQTLIKLTRNRLNILPHEEIDIEQPFEEMGFDSLLTVELTEALRKEFDLPLSTTLLYEYPTISKISAFLEEKLHNKTAASDPEEMSLDELETMLNQKLNRNVD